MNSPFEIDDASDRQAERTEKARVAREQREADVKFVMSKPAGRRFVRHLLDQAGVYRSSMAEGIDHIAFNEGRRDQGLRLIADLTKLDPKNYLKMLTENLTRADA